MSDPVKPLGSENIPQIQIDIDDATAQGAYSNLVLLNHNDNEFVLDFAYVQPATARARVRARILSSPATCQAPAPRAGDQPPPLRGALRSHRGARVPARRRRQHQLTGGNIACGEERLCRSEPIAGGGGDPARVPMKGIHPTAPSRAVSVPKRVSSSTIAP